jgi:predicted Zn-dependent protease
MMHNTTPTAYFDGKTARPQLVRVLLFNKQVHVYEADTEQLIQSYPLAGCSLVENTRPQVYLTAEQTSYLVLDNQNAITGLLVHTLQARQQNWFSRLFKTQLLLLLSIIAALAIGVYFLFTEAVPRVGLSFISVQQEERLGKTILGSVVDINTIDSTSSKLAQDFTNRLQLSKIYAVKVYVVKQKEVNAFALPGGIVVINSGIIEKMGSYEELAALLGHEVTHINDRHSLRALLRQLSFTAIISIITGDASGIYGAIISNAAALQSLSYSRGLEAAADQKGMQILVDNQVNPEGMIKLMERLQTSGHNLPVDFLSSHPLTTKRIAAANAFIKQHNGITYTPHPDLENYWKQLKMGSLKIRDPRSKNPTSF